MQNTNSKAIYPASLDVIHYKIIEMLSSLPRGKALDLPAGPGRLSLWLKQQGFDVTAADLSPDAFLASEIPVMKVDLDDPFPIEDGIFDYAFCIEGPEHVENLYHTFREFYRILKPGGKIIISYPNYSNIESRIKMIFYGVLEPVEPLQLSNGKQKNNGHINRQPVALVKQAMDHAGFSIERIQRENLKRNQLLFYPLYLLIRLFTLLKGKRGEQKYWLQTSNQFDVAMGGNSILIIASKKEILDGP